jgi:hypothetical protein
MQAHKNRIFFINEIPRKHRGFVSISLTWPAVQEVERTPPGFILYAFTGVLDFRKAEKTCGPILGHPGSKNRKQG